MLNKDNVAVWGAIIISTIVTVGFFLMLYMVIQREIPAGSRDIANTMLGYLGGVFTAVVGYWVGSSVGSARKDATISKLSEDKSGPDGKAAG